MRIATWNINSVRLRLPLLLRLLAESDADIICLQETKCPDEHFPADAIRAAGWTHVHFRGQKSYNGVAILSRLPFAATDSRDWTGRPDCRHCWVTLKDGTELHNFYIPAGGDIPDRKLNDKFAHKLDFIDEMTGWLAAERASDAPLILVGDLNVAPLEHDVWSHRQLLDVVSHTPIEVEKLTAMRQSIGMLDAVRHFVPEDQKLYSWWSYRARDWEASDRGRRLDHVWVTAPLKRRLKAAQVLKPVRGWGKASDHAPVLVDFS